MIIVWTPYFWYWINQMAYSLKSLEMERDGKNRLKCQILTTSEKHGLPTVTGTSFQDSKALEKLDNYYFFT